MFYIRMIVLYNDPSLFPSLVGWEQVTLTINSLLNSVISVVVDCQRPLTLLYNVMTRHRLNRMCCLLHTVLRGPSRNVVMAERFRGSA